MSKYVIIGNGVASIAAIESIRDNDGDGSITVISEEPHLTYSRPLITYLLAGKVSGKSMLYRDEDFYRENKVEVLLEKRAVDICTEKNSVTLDDQERISFDKLLIATGGTPILPNLNGNELKGVFTFTKWDDGERISSYIRKNEVNEVTVVGGGLMGLKTAEALLELGLKVNIVELADRILGATFDRKASNIIQPRLEEADCKVITKNTVSMIKGREKVNGVTLEEGEELDCNIVILAIGVKPNVEIVKDTAIEVNRGILVDDHMQTSIPNIYAAGDVVECPDIIEGDARPMAIWPNAHRQGGIAGINMTGGREEYEGSFAMNSVELCGLPTISIGLTDPGREEYEVLDRYDEENSVYKKVVLEENRIVGGIFINEIDRAGIYTGLIKDKLNVSSFKEHLLKDDFGLIFLPEKYRKHLVTGPGIEV